MKIPRPREAKELSQGPTSSSNASLPAQVCLIPNPCSNLSLTLFTSRKNSLFEFVSEHRLNCPGELLAKAKGENLFKDENTVVRRALQAAPWKLGSSYGSSGFLWGCSHLERQAELPRQNRGGWDPSGPVLP